MSNLAWDRRKNDLEAMIAREAREEFLQVIRQQFSRLTRWFR
jgi:hypothetical protein